MEKEKKIEIWEQLDVVQTLIKIYDKGESSGVLWPQTRTAISERANELTRQALYHIHANLEPRFKDR